MTMISNSDDEKNSNLARDGGGQRNSSSSHSRTNTSNSASSSSDGKVRSSDDAAAADSSSSSSSSKEEKDDIKNLQVLFGALLQYDRFNNPKNFTHTSSPAQDKKEKGPAMKTAAPSSSTTTAAATTTSHDAPSQKKGPKVVEAVVVDKQQQQSESLSSETTTSTTTTTTKNQKYAAAAAKSLAAFLVPPAPPNDNDLDGDEVVQVQDTFLYQSTYKLLQWQRDNYMVGSDFANWRREERVKEQREQQQLQQQQQAAAAASASVTAPISKPPPPPPLVYTYREMMQQLPHYNDADDATVRQALGPIQLANLAQDFIPSHTVRQVALPMVVALPGSPALYSTTKTSLVALILGQQENMNGIMKSAIISVFQNPEYRRAMKTSTKGYMMVSQQQQDPNIDGS